MFNRISNSFKKISSNNIINNQELKETNYQKVNKTITEIEKEICEAKKNFTLKSIEHRKSEILKQKITLVRLL